MELTKRSFLAAAALAGAGPFSMPATAADMIGNCELTGQKGSIPIANPAKAGPAHRRSLAAGADLVERRHAGNHQGRHGILHGGRNRLARRL